MRTEMRFIRTHCGCAFITSEYSLNNFLTPSQSPCCNLYFDFVFRVEFSQTNDSWQVVEWKPRCLLGQMMEFYHPAWTQLIRTSTCNLRNCSYMIESSKVSSQFRWLQIHEFGHSLMTSGVGFILDKPHSLFSTRKQRDTKTSTVYNVYF